MERRDLHKVECLGDGTWSVDGLLVVLYNGGWSCDCEMRDGWPSHRGQQDEENLCPHVRAVLFPYERVAP